MCWIGEGIIASLTDDWEELLPIARRFDEVTPPQWYELGRRLRAITWPEDPTMEPEVLTGCLLCLRTHGVAELRIREEETGELLVSSYGIAVVVARVPEWKLAGGVRRFVRKPKEQKVKFWGRLGPVPQPA